MHLPLNTTSPLKFGKLETREEMNFKAKSIIKRTYRTDEKYKK
jgi:hypothetical protein